MNFGQSQPTTGVAAFIYDHTGRTLPVYYTQISTGELAGVTSATQCPDVACQYVRIKARSSNTGHVYLGASSEVTKADGTSDLTTGFDLAPGDDTGWMMVNNLSLFWRICDNLTDSVTFLVLVA